MPASEKPELDTAEPTNRAARRAAKSGKRHSHDRTAQSTKGSQGKPAAQAKNYAFRRA